MAIACCKNNKEGSSSDITDLILLKSELFSLQNKDIKTHTFDFFRFTHTNFTSNLPPGTFKGIIATECHRYRYLSCATKELNIGANYSPIDSRNVTTLNISYLSICSNSKTVRLRQIRQYVKATADKVLIRYLVKVIRRNITSDLSANRLMTIHCAYKQYNILKRLLQNKYKYQERKLCNRTGKKK